MPSPAMEVPGSKLLPGLGGPGERRSIPLWLKLGYGVAVPVIAAVYWRAYGPQNYLWLSDIALGLTAAAVWTGSRRLASMPAVGMLPFELVWSLDFLAGGSVLGLAAYMFDSELSVYLRSLSLFHVALPPTLVWLLYRFGYDPKAFAWQLPLTWTAFVGAYGLADPAENINWVYGPGEPQEMMPPLAWLGFMMVVYPLAVMLPAHYILKRLFPARSRPAVRNEPAVAAVLAASVDSRSETMAAKAGERAQETGDFRCEKCHQQVHVSKGDKIPKCPNCGNDTFDTRYHEPGNKS